MVELFYGCCRCGKNKEIFRNNLCGDCYRENYKLIHKKRYNRFTDRE